MLISLIIRIQKKHKADTWLSRSMQKIFDYLTFGIYIRYITAVYLVLLLSCISEVHNYENIHLSRKISISFASAILIFFAFFALLSIFQWLKTFKRANINKMYYFTEFFKGMKDSKSSKLFITIFWFRRILFWLIIFFYYEKWKLWGKLALFTGLQVIYLLFLIFTKPYLSQKSNICDIINEFNYTLLSSMLIILNQRKSWNEPLEFSYIFLIIVNILIFALISWSKSDFLCCS